MNRYITLGILKENSNTTITTIDLDGKLIGFALEDGYKKEKVAGKTRIKRDKYEIKKLEVLTPLTLRYRDRFEWFDWHLEITNVPDFTNCYIHVGNSEEDSDGCVLCGYSADLNTMNIGNSARCYKELYLAVSEWLDNGDKVYIVLLGD